VKIGFFRSQDDLIYHDEVNGDLFTLARAERFEPLELHLEPWQTRAGSGPHKPWKIAGQCNKRAPGGS
jgi:hypothetical protein